MYILHIAILYVYRLQVKQYKTTTRYHRCLPYQLNCLLYCIKSGQKRSGAFFTSVLCCIPKGKFHLLESACNLEVKNKTKKTTNDQSKSEVAGFVVLYAKSTNHCFSIFEQLLIWECFYLSTKFWSKVREYCPRLFVLNANFGCSKHNRNFSFSP